MRKSITEINNRTLSQIHLDTKGDQKGPRSR